MHCEVFDGVSREAFAKYVVDSQAEWNDDPSVQLNRYLSMDKTDGNVSRYTDRKIDELYDRQRLALDPKKREEIVVELQRYLIEQVYSAPGFWSNRNVALDTKVQGWVNLPSHMLNQDLAEIWLKP